MLVNLQGPCMVLEWFNIFKFYFFSMKETCTFCDEEACVFSPPWPVEYLLHCTLPVHGWDENCCHRLCLKFIV